MVDPFANFDRQARGFVLGIVFVALRIAVGLIGIALKAVMLLVTGIARLFGRAIPAMEAKAAERKTGRRERQSASASPTSPKPESPAAGWAGTAFGIALAIGIVGMLSYMFVFNDNAPTNAASPTGAADQRPQTPASEVVDDVLSDTREAEAGERTSLPLRSSEAEDTNQCLATNRPDPNQTYQVKQMNPGPLRLRTSPTTLEGDANISGALGSLYSPLVFAGCVVGSDGARWWTTDGNLFVSSDFIEPLQAVNNCPPEQSPSANMVYKVSERVPIDDPLAVRHGPGTEYDDFDAYGPRVDGLTFLGCTRSSTGGPWWLLDTGGYVSGNFIEVSS